MTWVGTLYIGGDNTVSPSTGMALAGPSSGWYEIESQAAVWGYGSGTIAVSFTELHD
jgi:hypothetical protein